MFLLKRNDYNLFHSFTAPNSAIKSKNTIWFFQINKNVNVSFFGLPFTQFKIQTFLLIYKFHSCLARTPFKDGCVHAVKILMEFLPVLN